MNTKFKAGDKVVRLPEYARGWTDPVGTVSSINYESPYPQLTLVEHGQIHFNAEYFEAEYVYNSPLNQELK